MLANLIGTTGAAMLLIRPLLETNQRTAATCVTRSCSSSSSSAIAAAACCRIGDPPLFLGYLEGVPFLWTLSAVAAQWLFVNGLLARDLFAAWDHFVFYRRESKADIDVDEIERTRRLQFRGWP